MLDRDRMGAGEAMVADRRSDFGRRWPLVISLVAFATALLFVGAAYAAAFSVVGLMLFVAGLALLGVSVAAFLSRWTRQAWQALLAAFVIVTALVLVAPGLQRFIGSFFAD